ncbi:acyl carrier protein phosphodiesterase [Tamilnaduibacter salinus]|uniref:ACP phosphodiesterase n=1 Tax=Tamilnaduibacter salinus TaxID=1484056 RepID=A0A2A2I555_9GAMM|nr:ACP phosphodiesterase [Tamilnaduibacter salinus]PAV26414.1 ACP phosphodiesterase [Tamilnaduibacter salinus]PVY78147.1 acyl carrier protein phosphodiesterase [Tamilnaduibacter salinus]
MNHLAHLYLSRPTVESRVGNLLGDFAQGIDPDALPNDVRAGLMNHRAVDRYTDAHPDVQACKTLFSRQRRRFAGVALDVLFDHYLLRHWEEFTDTPKRPFIESLYQDLARGQPLMPEPMQRTTQHMIRHDWFGSYEDLDNIGAALDRIAGRIRFSNRFSGIIEEIRVHDDVLEARFLCFFSDLEANFNPPS